MVTARGVCLSCQLLNSMTCNFRPRSNLSVATNGSHGGYFGKIVDHGSGSDGGGDDVRTGT